MNIFISFAAGMLIMGMIVMTWGKRAAHRINPAPNPLASRWSLSSGNLGERALVTSLRRQYPTHDIITNERLIDVVKPTGSDAERLLDHLRDIRLDVVMRNKRTGENEWVVLASHGEDDGPIAAILRKAGMRTEIHDMDVNIGKAA